MVGGIMTVYPRSSCATGRTLLHRRRAGHRPDRAGPRPDQPLVPRPCRAARLDPRRLCGLLQGVHPPGLPGGPLRAGARAAGVPVPPVDVQRPQRRRAAVRPGTPPAAAAAALHDDDGYLVALAGLRPAGRARLLGADHERHCGQADQAQRPSRPGPLRPASARRSTSSTTASAWPRAAGSSSTRSSPTTGRSCSARSRSTPSSS